MISVSPLYKTPEEIEREYPYTLVIKDQSYKGICRAVKWLNENIQHYENSDIPTLISPVITSETEHNHPMSDSVISKKWFLTFYNSVVELMGDEIIDVVYMIYFSQSDDAIKFKLMGF